MGRLLGSKKSDEYVIFILPKNKNIKQHGHHTRTSQVITKSVGKPKYLCYKKWGIFK